MGELAKLGRDKVTLLTSPSLAKFGLWVEQLVAESSGKEGKGIVPVVEEPLGEAESYRKDRLFVVLTLGEKKDKLWEERAKCLETSHPVVHIRLKDLHDLGGEFFRWEIAVSVACASLGVNTFDQPDVQSAKDLTKSVLENLKKTGSLPRLQTHFEGKKFKLTFSEESLRKVSLSHSDPVEVFKQFIQQAANSDYFGILAYLPSSAGVDKKLSQLRTLLREKTGASTLFGYGPRYLHSTGQLHKGGPNNGLFLIFKRDPEKDISIPEESYTFGNLENAQANGDFQALNSRKRRAVCIHLLHPIEDALDEILHCAHSSVG
ncbi:MAG: hypothetical protein HYY63_05940 [Elusimicrobia bacterium]|nr:hypothetical protein [Elusimicrobiota bacterium]